MASSCQDEQSPLPHGTSSQVLVNREESLTRQSQDCSCSEADKPPREFPGVLLVLVPHVLERVLLPRLHVVDDFVADVAQHLKRNLFGEVVQMPIRSSKVG